MKDITIEERACAKVNLALHVTGVREDGYHTLDSIIFFTDISDRLFIKKRGKNGLSLTGEFSKTISVKKNTILQVLKLFQHELTDRFSINLEKNLPIGAGLGGGSADAAAVIRFLVNYYTIPMPSLKSISKIGADIPACIASVASRVEGIGEIVKPINITSIDVWIVLVNPRIFVSTSSIFQELTQKRNKPLSPFSDFNNTDRFIDYLKSQRNDLQAIAVNKWPEIGYVLHTIQETQGVLLSRMSGSGSTCFGLYKSQEIAKKAANYINKKNNKWWIKFSKLN